MTPQEWKAFEFKGDSDKTDEDILMSDYAAYVISKQPKKDIILPEYRPVDFARLKFDPTEHENVTWNNCIDTTKELNGL